MAFAIITSIAIALCWILGVYAVYTYREVELAKLEHADKLLKAARDKYDRDSNKE